MARVFTIFCCGTASNSFDFANAAYHEGELVSTLARNHAGREFVDWILLDGPGSGGLQREELWAQSYSSMFFQEPKGKLLGKQWEENAQAAVAYVKGVADWQGDQTLAKAKRNALVAELLKQHEDAIGAMTGKDVSSMKVFKETRTKRAVSGAVTARPRITPQMLQQKQAQIFRKNEAVTTVNLIGWSRGGITCHMIANRLQAELPAVKVNIFALDPVPGLGNFADHRTVLAGNVKRYVGVYARHELSVGFSPSIPDRRPATESLILSMWGRHATLVGNAAADGAKSDPTRVKEPGIIVRDLAEKTLESWGTTLNNKKELDAVAICELYDRMVKDYPIYWEMRKKQYTIRQRSGLKKVDIRQVREGNGGDVPFNDVPGLDGYSPYVNAHHLAVALRCAWAGQTARLGRQSVTRQTVDPLAAVVPARVSG